MRSTPALLLCAATVALAGCAGSRQSSSGDFKGQERLVAVAVEDLQDAARDGDSRKICDDLLAGRLLASLRQAGTSCRQGVEKALDDADTFELDVKDVRVSGTRADARVTAGADDDETDTLSLVREQGNWKIASLGAAGRKTPGG